MSGSQYRATRLYVRGFDYGSCTLGHVPCFRVDSKTMEYGCREIYAGFSFVFGFGIRGQSYSNFLVSTVM